MITESKKKNNQKETIVNRLYTPAKSAKDIDGEAKKLRNGRFQIYTERT